MLRRILSLFSFLLSCMALSAQHVGKYELPASYNSGLSTFFITYRPEFKIVSLGTTEQVHLKMNIKPSSAQNMEGAYWYQYRYNGRNYSDADLGREVFNPISFDLELRVRVQGPTVNKSFTYKSTLGNIIIGSVPANSRPEDFSVTIEGLSSVYFRGKESIEGKIRDLLAKKANPVQNSAGAGSTTSKDADENKWEKKAGNDSRGTSSASTQNNTTRRNSTTKSATDDELWGSGRNTTASSAANRGIDGTGKPEFIETTDGRYYQKGADNKMHEISYDDMMRIRHERSRSTQPKDIPKKLTEAETKAEVDKVMAKVKKDQEASEQIYKDIDRKFDQYAQAAANNKAVDESRENLREVSTLSGNFQSVEQLMAEYNQKMRQVNTSVEQLRESKNAAWNHAIGSSFDGPNDAAYGEALKAVGGIVNAAKAAKDRKDAQAELKAQKEAALNDMIAEQKRLLVAFRTELFSRYKQGQIPLSSAKVSSRTLYYFAYAYEPSQLQASNPQLQLSNVFPIGKYTDGSWPYESNIFAAIQSITHFKPSLVGFYASEKDAIQAHSSLTQKAKQMGFAIKPFHYNGKKVTSKAASENFWGEEKKTESQKDDEDFWKMNKKKDNNH